MTVVELMAAIAFSLFPMLGLFAFDGWLKRRRRPQ
jgi:hypothetical protein